jgi:hypothetical protein
LAAWLANKYTRNPFPKGTREAGGRWGGTTFGVLSGVVVGGYVAGTTQNDVGPGVAVFLVIASAMSVGGYLLGKSADQRSTTIRVVP